MSYAPARRLLAAALLALTTIFAAAVITAPADAGGKKHSAKGHHAKKHHGHGKHAVRGNRHGHHRGKRHGNRHHGKHHGGDKVKVMTRNLYLGADLTPAIEAGTPEEALAAVNQILGEVIANDFPTRAKGLTREILRTKPDLVGLQEVALWSVPLPSGTTTLDYLQLLLGQLNHRGHNYRVAVSQDEFGIEAPVDTDGDMVPDASGSLQMRDVILVRTGAGVAVRNKSGDNFENPLVLPNPVLGPITVDRGWTSVDARVRHSHWFHFVNTHLEAFHPRVRGAQAQELVAPGGPATSHLPVVLVGDLNTDDDTVAFPDTYAYSVLTDAGMVERSTGNPLSCCIDSSLLAVGAGGSIADFDHQVDHVMTRDPRKVKLDYSLVTGRYPMNGFWDSDHAGVFSALKLK